MRTKRVLFILAIVIIGLGLGCSVIEHEDGTMGLKLGMAEETHQQVQDTLTGAAETVGGLSQVFPALLPIATALGVGGGVWHKMKKAVTKKQKPLEMLVGVLENIKQTDQATWDKVRAKIKTQYPSLELKATIQETLIELKKQGELVTTNVVNSA